MAGSAAGAAQRRKGTHAAQRRTGAAAAGTAVGSYRQGVSIRDRRRKRDTGGPLRRALAAPYLPFHVWPRLHRGMPVVLEHRRRVRGLRCPPCESRRHTVGGVASASRETAGVQAADGLELSLGVVV